MKTIWLILLLGIGILPGNSFAQAEQFLVHTADGKQIPGPLAQVAKDWTIRLSGPKPALIAGTDLVSLRRKGSYLPPFPTKTQLVFSNGDRLPLGKNQPLILNGDFLEIPLPTGMTSKTLESTKVPMPYLSLIWIAAPKRTLRPEILIRKLASQKHPRGLVLLRNGDRIFGILTQLDGKGSCRIKEGGRIKTIPLEQVAAIAPPTIFQAKIQPKAPYGQLVFRNGTRLSLKSARITQQGKTLTGISLFGFPIEIPLQKLVSLQLANGKATYLSELEPSSYHHHPYFQLTWSLTKDQNVLGSSLTLQDGCYRKGIGMHTGTQVSYKLDKKYHWFESKVGLDAKRGKLGSANIAIFLDGKEQNLPKKGSISGKSSPLIIRVSIKNTQTITLRVGYSTTANIQGYVNWVNARLIKP